MDEVHEQRQRELAVLELAEKVVRATCENSRALLIKALRVAVNDLTAHQPVDPQTLEPGQKFRFEDATKYQEFIAIKSEGRMVGLSDWRTFEFVTGARVIPLSDDTK